MLYSGIFWLGGAGPLDVHRAVFRSASTGLITVVAAFFLLENILQKWLAPVFFPQGGLSKTSRVMRIRRHARRDAGCIRDEILTALSRFQNGVRPEDDVTLSVVKFDAPSATRAAA